MNQQNQLPQDRMYCPKCLMNIKKTYYSRHKKDTCNPDKPRKYKAVIVDGKKVYQRNTEEFSEYYNELDKIEYQTRKGYFKEYYQKKKEQQNNQDNQLITRVN